MYGKRGVHVFCKTNTPSLEREFVFASTLVDIEYHFVDFTYLDLRVDDEIH